MRVACEVVEVELEGDYASIEGLCVSCSRCYHEVEVYGTSGRSVRRAMVMLREECPRGEANWYAAEDDTPCEPAVPPTRIRQTYPTPGGVRLVVLPFPDGEFAWICPADGIYQTYGDDSPGTKWTADMAISEPRTVCGIDLDPCESATFCRAACGGELVQEQHEPCGSPVPEAFRRWCESKGLRCVIRKNGGES